MKTSSDPRHQLRRHLVQKLFTYNFDSNQHRDLDPVIRNLESIDSAIKLAAPEWPIEKINPVDLSILRLAGYELLVAKQEPVKVIIDEAIELAKEFGSESSPAFINGALGAILKSLDQNA